MAFSIRRMGVGQLIGTWGAYWTGLAGVTLAPFARWVWDLNRLPGQHGSASLSIGDGGVTLTALKDNVTVYSGLAPIWQVALWIAVPPLVLWISWLALRPAEAERAAHHGQVIREALPDPARNGWGAPITPTSSASPLARRERRER